MKMSPTSYPFLFRILLLTSFETRLQLGHGLPHCLKVGWLKVIKQRPRRSKKWLPILQGWKRTFFLCKSVPSKHFKVMEMLCTSPKWSEKATNFGNVLCHYTPQQCKYVQVKKQRQSIVLYTQNQIRFLAMMFCSKKKCQFRTRLKVPRCLLCSWKTGKNDSSNRCLERIKSNAPSQPRSEGKPVTSWELTKTYTNWRDLAAPTQQRSDLREEGCWILWGNKRQQLLGKWLGNVMLKKHFSSFGCGPGPCPLFKCPSLQVINLHLASAVLFAKCTAAWASQEFTGKQS